MKKFDIVTILSVFFIALLFYTLYFINIDKSGDLYAQFSYNKKVIYAVKIEDNINITIDIASNDQILTITKKDGTGKVLETKTVETDNKKRIENSVQITDKEILMIHANCQTKRCMYMKITKNIPTPIICTNGITVELIYDDVYDYIHIL